MEYTKEQILAEQSECEKAMKTYKLLWRYHRARGNKEMAEIFRKKTWNEHATICELEEYLK
jgi:hypothetical protein